MTSHHVEKILPHPDFISQPWRKTHFFSKAGQGRSGLKASDHASTCTCKRKIKSGHESISVFPSGTHYCAVMGVPRMISPRLQSQSRSGVSSTSGTRF